ncbi:putative house-cleaning noncanonical NTP pyrophosphatase (MazG superfamily) [Alkalibacillus filiformis]|uniref:House-cleaning noncanonical NTP pyrophosphatase (MazG superfamily) n=1 Tax=Alkalibacillus filiformis TaxID=200990 RepID=A0ABU0DSA7_9BACI|nr:nucleoside triphosphate pyrophosphohydrolase [Alkalibacillus filiformis]MDQ0351338.1 putative house-cleaning noncanonical NTP pyrophosphatase (MazG superfamily) [Alkalibacillus filiformis]
MPTYNKLVRDKIPQIIAATGKSYTTDILSEEKYIKELKAKLSEELNEYLQTNEDNEALEELADVLELIHSLTKVHGSSIEQLEKIREEKAQQRGGFNERVYLKEVEG